jgi:hypothetical protein
VEVEHPEEAIVSALEHNHLVVLMLFAHVLFILIYNQYFTTK